MRNNSFNDGGSLSPQRYLNNKEHFDNGLINTIEDLCKKEKKLIAINKKLQATIINKEAFIRTLSFKLKDFKVNNYNLKQRLSSTDNNLDILIKEQREKQEKLDKKIDEELKKSYEDLIEIYEENQRLKKDNEKLKRENERLTKSNSKDSYNSSLPPSSDIIYKRIKSTREKSNKKLGGQLNHKLNKSKLDTKVDQIIERTVKKAPTGAYPIKDAADNVLYYATQEIDVSMETFITETRYYICVTADECPSSILGDYKINPVTYSNSFISMVLYLNSKGTIPLERLCTMLNELSHKRINLKASTIVNWSARFERKSQVVLKRFQEELLTSKLNYVDESGWKVNASNYWMHVLCNDNTALFVCSKQRSGTKEGPISFLSDYTGYLVHDHYKPYYTNLRKCEHVECGAHIIRYLNSSIELEKNMGCVKLKNLIQKMIKEKAELINQKQMEMTKTRISELEKEYHKIIDETLEKYYKENPNMPNKYKPDYVNLLKRLKEYSRQHLMFIKDFRVPFDNNHAERMIRGIKTKKKVSNQSKNIAGASNYAAIHSINQTCSLRKMNTLKTIEAILNDKDPFDCFLNNLSFRIIAE